jgi:thiamine-phosphate pyrophosphorylase
MTRCLVTDRRRLCPGHPPFAVERRSLLEQVRRAVAAGVELIHVRERDLEAACLAALVGDIMTIARGTLTRVVVNDRLDVAMASAADGVHLRGDSIPIEAARRLAPPPFLVGRSVHSAAEARAGAGADYLIAGTVFPSTSKGEGAPVIGLDGLKAIVAAATVPVLAIGGVTADRVAEVTAAGAAGVAGISLFIDRLKPAS